ncbi:hypothetical protein CBM2597_U10116 [Cupriavidus taiwanensis]|uniref:Uncharacterized protein n=1 Tax=Cupriavidus taiwanensis TaxID=164546 RepID=A0A7Z7NQ67_9BURK|nr:hypothetical protein CBM2597_U10116 [Cupriavidus taiwanensis]SPC25622.1 hypothetical protein CBM2594_U10123 [Cupriavidus taiwanensis]
MRGGLYMMYNPPNFARLYMMYKRR